MKLVKFSTNYRDVYINPSNVVRVSAWPSQELVDISLSTGEEITVIGSLEEVVAKLMG